jgi:DNA primase
VTVLYDGDAAGIKASLRGIDMLLAEGLNVHVLLLPAGEDPDSFSKKQNSKSFLEYIESHEVDFIQFKTNLLLKDVEGDAQKRSEAIREIVKSIAVIPDRITQQAFVSQCAKQVGIQEQIIATEVYEEIQKIKGTFEAARQTEAALNVQAEKTEKPLTLDGMNAIESELLKIVIRHGSSSLFEDEAENGEKYQWTVATFIQANLRDDGIQFSKNIYQEILDLAAVLQPSEGVLSTMHYFLNNENPEIQQIAAQMADDNYELSFRQKEMHKPDEERLVEIVSRLLNEFKFNIVESRQKELLEQMNIPEVQQDSEMMQKNMKEFMDLNMLKQKLSPLIGERILTIKV